jgi:hypothetical protein
MNPLNRDIPVILLDVKEAVKQKRTEKHGEGYQIQNEAYVRATKRQRAQRARENFHDYASRFAQFNRISVEVAKVDPECKRAYREDIPADQMFFRSTYMKREDCRDFDRF